jgi:hypothetical protein
MAANKPRWPQCACTERCKKPKCNPPSEGSRELAVTDAAKGANLEIARGLLSRRDHTKSLKRLLVSARDVPSLAAICRKAGVSRTLLRYWLTLSRKGRKGDFFDVPVEEGRTERFHVLFEDAMEQAWDNVEIKAYNLATGVEREILHHQGHVSYLMDPDLIAFGFTGEAAYLRDKDGKPIPETVPLLDPEMVRWLLARRRSKEYGNKMQVEHEHKGGVLVVGVTKTSAQLEKDYSMKHADIEDVEFEDITDEAESAA